MLLGKQKGGTVKQKNRMLAKNNKKWLPFSGYFQRENKPARCIQIKDFNSYIFALLLIIAAQHKN
ncbi:hypothetical protein WH50_18535 [Pokkaliibacter plantistimulans]|uniref:Transposase n=1 Tax=Pokkaliibacter plantistimulans TaxID=1635171 RepID=A0ABX5LW31_9GAMM|nr:hypothetical protein WH50_18535 [Pokkaliibacter plantistimulans]